MLLIKKEDAQELLNFFTKRPHVYAEIAKYIDVLLKLKPLEEKKDEQTTAD